MGQPLSKDGLIRNLAEFRYQLRQFLVFSEHAAMRAGVQPQQHQLLLQIAGSPDPRHNTIAWAAERLGLQHHSAVELVDRCAAQGWIERAKDQEDARRVILRITAKGHRILGVLSADHARELREMAPHLIRALDNIHPKKSAHASPTTHKTRQPPSTRAISRSKPHAGRK
jgi:DNA-binding MarR family transcriptional regulator